MLRPLLVLLLSALLLVAQDYSTLTNPFLIPPFDQPLSLGGPGVTQYLVFHSGLSANFTEGRRRCRALGGDLADVESVEVLNYLAARVHGPAFVASWLGSHMGFACMAVFPGGAIAGKMLLFYFLIIFLVPEEGCVGRIGSICEVPLFSSASIHIGATASNTSDLAHDYPEARGQAVKEAREPANPDGIHIYRDGKRLQGAKQAGKTVTMTIYGSIATNPVLPCCKCC